jgi:hypothetical protein
VVSSILSRHTGHVGSSTRLGVGGGNGFKKAELETEGVKGSWESSGKLVFGLEEVGVWNVMDLMNMTWQVSGYQREASTFTRKNVDWE